MRTLVRFLLALSALCVLAPFGHAQTGGITGKVTDSGGGVLQGAEVTVDPGGNNVVSDAQGQFLVTGLTPGTYKVTINYVGFTTVTNSVTVEAGQVAGSNAKLVVASQNLEVLVTADRASGEAEEVNRQRTADNILQVLTNDVITSLPNANIADAVGRLPSVTLERDEGEGKYVQVRGTEPRLTNGTIDGVNIPSPESGVRQIKFDAIPSDIVEAVEINKTLQANMDADGIGGSVNLVTKTATERPTVSLYGQGGIIPILGGRNDYSAKATIGKRFGSRKKFGVLGGFSYDFEGRGIDDTEPVPDINNFGTPQQQRWFDSADIREYKYYRERWGAAGSTDYQLGQGSNIYLRGLFSVFHNFGDRWVYTLNDNSSGSNINLLNGNGGPPSFNNETRRPRYIISNLVVGGRHDLTSTWFAWDVAGSFASENDDGYGNGAFGVPTPSTFTSACTFDPVATGQTFPPHWSPACFTEAYNPSIYVLRDFNISRGKTAQTNIQAAGAMGKRYHIGSHLATIEIGGKFRNGHKYDHSYTDDYPIPTVGGTGPTKNDLAPTAPLIPFNNFPSTFHNSDYYWGGAIYPQGPFADYFKTKTYVLANLGSLLSSGAAGQPNFYSYIEQVSAGYVMNTLDFSKFRFVAGVRVEGTNLDTLTWDNQANTLSLRAGGDYTKVLPSASLRYALTSNDNIRLVYSRGLSRPNPQDIAQSFSITAPAAGGNGSLSFGNPALAAETANNYDLLFEHYMHSFGAIQAGVFFKSLYDPIVSTSHLVQNFTPPPPYNTPGFVGNYIISQPINAGGAHLYGFEIAYLQHFSSLPGLLSRFGLSANYSYTDSGTEGLPGRTDHPHLLRQAPNTWNISPTFDRGRFSYRLGLSYNEANIFSYQYHDGSGGSTATPGGLLGPNGDTYLYTHFQIDMQGSMRLQKGFTFVGAILNLNNEVFGFYNGSSPYMIQREFYHPTYYLGMRWSPTHER